MPALGRLRKRPEFLRVAAGRRKRVMPGLIVQALPRAEPGPASEGSEADVRYGITVSRKVGNAVERNRARRRIRALARELLPSLGRPGMDYVIIGRKATLARGHEDLKQDLVTAVTKLNAQPRGGSGPRGGRDNGRRQPSKQAPEPHNGSATAPAAKETQDES